ncbi:nuclear transport factor 2 family protein [Algoriphagus sp.]|uniref:nuclear transport factor 2 family protein n=1 Tax=Algoriphagus sp. TaxID=1872435 RepID=UPI0025D4C2D1|nr:nuclear transport factor 2 family protein [Algoriphagus sp.]
MKTLLSFLFFLIALTTYGQSENELAGQVEKLRLALIDPTENILKELSSASLTYGHSSGLLENQDQFIEALVSGKSDFSTASFEDQSIVIENNIGIVRHYLVAELVEGEKINSIKIGVMLIWQKEEGKWKLLARQAYKLS